MPHGAAHDPAQDVAAPVLGRHHPVGDQERGAAQVVGDDAVMRRARPVRIARCRVRRSLDQRAHQVGRVVVVRPLQDRRDPLYSHSGVDRLIRQRRTAAVLALLVLHEDEVPDLDEPVPVLLRAARRPAPVPLAVIVEDLGAGTARAGRPHLPEIVGRRDPDDAPVRQAGDAAPEVGGLVVVMVDRDQQTHRVDAQLPRHQIPGEGDRVGLEVIAETEVTEHLEERVVPRGIAYVVEVVVFAARAHAFLRCSGAHVVPRLDPGEQVLELHHPGVREHQGRIVPRHQRRGGHLRVPLRHEVVEEGTADLGEAGHGGPFGVAPM